MTANDIKERMKVDPKHFKTHEIGRIDISEKIQLVCNEDTKGPKKGEICYAELIYDEMGKYPNTVHIRGYGFWWDLSLFSFP